MPPAIRLVGTDVLFVHWPVDRDAVRRVVPAPLPIDTVDGQAWVTALAHEVTEVSLDALPGSPLPAFPQLDFRTYVEHDGDPGVYFLSCDTGRRVNTVLGTRAFHLPFTHARMDFDRRGDAFIIRSRRSAAASTSGAAADTPQARFDARYRPTGEAAPAEPGSVAESLVERHRYYTSATEDAEPTGDPSGRRRGF